MEAKKTETTPHHHHHHHHHGPHHPEDLCNQLEGLLLKAPAHPEPPQDGQAAWAHLKEGNEIFSEGHLGPYLLNVSRRVNPEHRKTLENGQKPYGCILSCSDSRAAPELIFGKGLGELFVVRVAGNVADPVVIGSLEYCIEHLGSTLLLILGHQKCGAVKAAVETHGQEDHGENSIGTVLAKIYPSVDKVKKAGGSGDIIDSVVQENVRATKETVLQQSKIIREHVESGKVVVVTAEYYLDSGLVKVLE